MCPPNTYSLPGSAFCLPCASGYVSGALSSACVPCAAGTYASPGASCLHCPAGITHDLLPLHPFYSFFVRPLHPAILSFLLSHTLHSLLHTSPPPIPPSQTRYLLVRRSDGVQPLRDGLLLQQWLAHMHDVQQVTPLAAAHSYIPPIPCTTYMQQMTPQSLTHMFSLY